MTVRRVRERRGWAVCVAVTVLKPLLLLLSRRRWLGGDNIPAEGGCVVVINHLSHVDPLMSAHYLYDHGRIPRFLAKAGLFKVAGVGQVLSSAQQIPVERLTAQAVDAYSAAVLAIGEGKCLVVYPEGTITRDPELWPMRGKSGAARIALETGCPVIPVGQWGAQEVLAPYGRRLHVLPRRTVAFSAGEPVDLGDLIASGAPTAEAIREANERIMRALVEQVAELRGEPAPTELFDLRGTGIREIGNPGKPEKSERRCGSRTDGHPPRRLGQGFRSAGETGEDRG